MSTIYVGPFVFLTILERLMSRPNRFQDELSLIFIYKVVSEVGVFTWNWPEGDLFVFLENNIISTETLLAFQVCETDS